MDTVLTLVTQFPQLFWIALGGDVILGNVLNARIPPDSGKVLFEEVRPWFQWADLGFVNLEGAFAIRPEERQKQFRFLMPPSTIAALSYLGVSGVSVANNHIYDGGPENARKTVDLLREQGWMVSGLAEDGCVMRRVVPARMGLPDSIRVGFCAFSVYPHTLNLLDEEHAMKQIKEMDSLVDILVVSFHAGAEGGSAYRVRNQTEYFYGENRGNVVRFARRAVDAGADLVFGHGPHVLRGMEIYRGRFIAYSLGNFACWYGLNLAYPRNLSVILLVGLQPDGEFQQGQIVPLILEPPGIPRMDPRKQAIQWIQERIREDHLKGLRVDSTGRIFRVP